MAVSGLEAARLRLAVVSADGVKVIGRERWKSLAVQVLEAAAGRVGIDLPVNPGGGDD